MKLYTRTECTVPFNKANAVIWEATAKVCAKTGAGNLLGFPVWAATEVVNFGRDISKFGETFFKGTANVTASPCVKDAKFFRGLLQLTMLIPQGFKILILPISILVNSLAAQTFLLIGGQKFAQVAAEEYRRRVEREIGCQQVAQKINPNVTAESNSPIPKA